MLKSRIPLLLVVGASLLPAIALRGQSASAGIVGFGELLFVTADAPALLPEGLSSRGSEEAILSGELLAGSDASFSVGLVDTTLELPTPLALSFFSLGYFDPQLRALLFADPEVAFTPSWRHVGPSQATAGSPSIILSPSGRFDATEFRLLSSQPLPHFREDAASFVLSRPNPAFTVEDTSSPESKLRSVTPGGSGGGSGGASVAPGTVAATTPPVIYRLSITRSVQRSRPWDWRWGGFNPDELALSFFRRDTGTIGIPESRWTPLAAAGLAVAILAHRRWGRRFSVAG